MSADEIKGLAQQVYCDGMSVKRGGFEHMSNRIEQCFAALLAYAAMVERCDKAVESMHTQLMHLANEGKTPVDIGRLSKYFAHLENILRGDAGKEKK